MKQVLVVCALTMILGGPTLAQTRTPGVRERQVNQQQRIHQGMTSGELTRPEVRRLEAQQQHIQNVKVRAKGDGVVTPAERARLDNMQDRASANIYHQKHDVQKRR
jgi:hypothetical protein